MSPPNKTNTSVNEKDMREILTVVKKGGLIRLALDLGGSPFGLNEVLFG